MRQKKISFHNFTIKSESSHDSTNVPVKEIIYRDENKNKKEFLSKAYSN